MGKEHGMDARSEPRARMAGQTPSSSTNSHQSKQGTRSRLVVGRPWRIETTRGVYPQRRGGRGFRVGGRSGRGPEPACITNKIMHERPSEEERKEGRKGRGPRGASTPGAPQVGKPPGGVALRSTQNSSMLLVLIVLFRNVLHVRDVLLVQDGGVLSLS